LAYRPQGTGRPSRHTGKRAPPPGSTRAGTTAGNQTRGKRDHGGEPPATRTRGPTPAAHPSHARTAAALIGFPHYRHHRTRGVSAQSTHPHLAQTDANPARGEMRDRRIPAVALTPLDGLAYAPRLRAPEVNWD
jgi:hypothetical protein